MKEWIEASGQMLITGNDEVWLLPSPEAIYLILSVPMQNDEDNYIN